MKNSIKILILFYLFLIASIQLSTAQTNYDYSQLKRENLGRGLIAIRHTSTRVFLSWRYFSSDPIDVKFNIYRDNIFIGNTIKTSFIDKNYNASKQCIYKIIPIIDGIEQEQSIGEYIYPENSKIGYLEIPLNVPADGITPDGNTYSYSANDASIGDVDGDGEYEIILKWDPSNSQDNSKTGYTGNVYIDCYKISGEKLWRIDLGKNIRAGAHYTQFLVYDFDGDNKAEIIMKTCDGTIDGKGNVIGNINADYRGSNGLILKGNEYLTVFNGMTGEAMATVDYVPERGDVKYWGDNYGNRSERYLACTAYLDGIKPSAVMCRGYYFGRSGYGPGRTVLAAWDWDGENLINKWTFDTKDTKWSSWIGQGNHSVRIADIDGDGCDEIIYGSMTINNDGTGLYNTKLGHGDAHHLTVFDPTTGKLSLWSCHEDGGEGSTFRDACDGTILFQIKHNDDVGRCMAADIDPNHKGLEMWSSRSGGILNINGDVINSSTSEVSMNMAIWWDGNLLRNLQDGTQITKYDYQTRTAKILLNATGCSSNNSTKANPCLIADILGDWREELLLRESNSSKLRLYVNIDTIEYKFHTFLEDPVYRGSIAHQNVAYNQPTNVGFYFGSDLGCMLKSDYSDESWSLDAGTYYDEYKWFLNDALIGSEKTINIDHSEMDPINDNEVKLISTFRGYNFIESSKILSVSASIKDFSSEKISVTYINNIIQIKLIALSEITNVNIYKLNGQYLNSFIIEPGQNFYELNTNQWDRGIYVLRIDLDDKYIIKKILVF